MSSPTNCKLFINFSNKLWPGINLWYKFRIYFHIFCNCFEQIGFLRERKMASHYIVVYVFTLSKNSITATNIFMNLLSLEFWVKGNGFSITFFLHSFCSIHSSIDAVRKISESILWKCEMPKLWYKIISRYMQSELYVWRWLLLMLLLLD